MLNFQSMIPKCGYRFPACAKPLARSFVWLDASAGEIPKLPLNLVLLKNCSVVGVFWGAWIDRDPEGHRRNMDDLVEWCAAGKLSAHVHAVYPLARTAEALKALVDRKAMGKILLKP